MKKILKLIFCLICLICLFGFFTGFLVTLGNYGAIISDFRKCQKPKTLYGYFPPHRAILELFCERF